MTKIIFLVSNDMHEAVKEYCQASGMTKAEFARRAIAEKLLFHTGKRVGHRVAKRGGYRRKENENGR